MSKPGTDKIPQVKSVELPIKTAKQIFCVRTMSSRKNILTPLDHIAHSNNTYYLQDFARIPILSTVREILYQFSLTY